MESRPLVDRVQSLGDLELAVLLSLVAQEHCLIWTEDELIDALGQELELACTKVFGLSPVVLECSEQTTLDDFSSGILIEDDQIAPSSQRATYYGGQSSYFTNRLSGSHFGSLSRSPLRDSIADSQRIANLVIAKNLNTARPQVQIQALELIRTKRIFTRTSFQSAPQRFVLIALLTKDSMPLCNHLNDHIFISHYHGAEDEFLNLEEAGNGSSSDTNSISSVIHTPRKGVPDLDYEPLLSSMEVDELIDKRKHVRISIEAMQYLQNISVFLRLHRAVAGGVSSHASKHFSLLLKCMAPLHQLEYVTPSLVALAARKIYPHRIEVAKPETERSMQWGSDYNAVTAMLDGLTAESIVEDVLGALEVPL